jgi:hypothetical protein
METDPRIRRPFEVVNSSIEREPSTRWTLQCGPGAKMDVGKDDGRDATDGEWQRGESILQRCSATYKEQADQPTAFRSCLTSSQPSALKLCNYI